MYIWKINIKNFKSFKEKTIVPFCQGLTVITGVNGSGKSNLIDAIKFILCRFDNRVKKDFDFINSEEKECFVEIVFEGEEERLTLGRKIGRNDDNSMTKLYYKDRIEVTEAVYENAVQKLSGLIIDTEFDRTDFENNVKNSEIYISDDIFCFLYDKKLANIGNFLKENAKNKQIIVVSHSEDIIKKADSIHNILYYYTMHSEEIIKKADSILEIPHSVKEYDLTEILRNNLKSEPDKTYKSALLIFADV